MRKFLLMLVAFVTFLPVYGVAAPALWKVDAQSTATGKGTLYILGSFHLLKVEDKWLEPEVEALFDRADRLVLETSADEMDPTIIQTLVRRHGVYPPGLRLKDRLPPHLWLRLTDVMRQMGRDANGLQQFKPWYTALVISVQFAQTMGFSPEEGVDRFFMLNAKAQGKPILGLESAEEQLAFFYHQYEPIQIRFLEDTLRQVEETPDVLADMTDAWRDGDLERMETLVISAMKEVPELYDALLVARNKLWLKKLTDYLKLEGMTFVVVGAAHLVGEDSLIRMLETQGLAVKRVR